MSVKSVAQKLLFKSGYKVLLVNAPKNYQEMLGPLPPGAALVKSPAISADLVQLFVADRRELEAQLGKMKRALAPNGLLWVTYHKGTSSVKTDINRDTIAAYAQTIGLRPVAMISIDEDWSVLRLKVV